MWAVIPVKNISQAKQRLSPSLKEEERKHLFSAMLEDVLSVVVKIHFFEKIILATNCQNAISIAKIYGVSVFTTGPDRGLNQAAIESANFLEGKGVKGMFLIPADIPLVTDKEIYSVLETHPPSPSVSIIPSQDKSGSNCLVLTPPYIMPMRFGKESFVRHKEIAQKRGLKINSIELTGFGLDIDTPEDLSDLMLNKGNTRSQKYLRQTRFWERVT